MSATSISSLDFSLLRNTTSYPGSRNQRVFLLLGLLLTLLLLSAAGLVAYLRDFESEEDVRTQSADALWLEETMRFHLRRLEVDLESLARRQIGEASPAQSSLPAPGGSLRSYEGGLMAHGWQSASAEVPDSLLAAWTKARLDPLNAQSLDSMRDVARGLGRAAYAGPLASGKGEKADEIWLAVPVFDRGQFLGSYVAVFSLSKTLERIVPAWFRVNHRVEVLDPSAEIQLGPTRQNRISKEQRFLASIDMPGSDTYLQIYSVDAWHATVPRALLGVALAFLTGMIASLYFLQRDIERRRVAEASLAAQVALRQAMEDSVDIGLFARDLSNVVLYANRAFCGIVVTDVDVLLGRQGPLPNWPSPPTSGQGTKETEIELQRPDGKTVQLMIHTVPLMHANDGQIGWMTSVLDVSDRRRSEKAAQLQQQRLESAGRFVAIGEVASTLAHELNQPLGALSSFANGLLNRLARGNIEPAQVRSIVERINSLAEKAGEIIRRVNAFARRREMHMDRVELTDFLKTRQQLGAANNVQIEVIVPHGPIAVRADVILLEQAVHNIVQNATEAAVSYTRKPQVRVELALTCDEAQAVISVSDSGSGIDEEARTRVFDAFYSSKMEGMGMGLAICRSILEAHHGRIDLVGDGPLGGATFRLLLPVDEP